MEQSTCVHVNPLNISKRRHLKLENLLWFIVTSSFTKPFSVVTCHSGTNFIKDGSLPSVAQQLFCGFNYTWALMSQNVCWAKMSIELLLEGIDITGEVQVACCAKWQNMVGNRHKIRTITAPCFPAHPQIHYKHRQLMGNLAQSTGTNLRKWEQIWAKNGIQRKTALPVFIYESMSSWRGALT